jgi:predicted ATP-dependent serine protease
MQICASIASLGASEEQLVVYISGEENKEQIAARAARLNLPAKNIFLVCTSDTDAASMNLLIFHLYR